MPWWDRVRPFLRHNFLRKPSAVKASKINDIAQSLTQTFVRRPSKSTSYFGDMTNQLGSRYNGYKKAIGSAPASVRRRALDVGRNARESTLKKARAIARTAMSGMAAIPIRAAKGLVLSTSACMQRVKVAAQAGSMASSNANRRTVARVLGIFPRLTSCVAWFGRRVVYVLFGMAFLYGLGHSIPGATVRFLVEREKQRQQRRLLNKKANEEETALPEESK